MPKAPDLRALSKSDLKKLLIYGDVRRLAMDLPYSYRYVSRVIRRELNNDEIWSAVITYLDSKGDLILSARTRRALAAIRKERAA